MLLDAGSLTWDKEIDNCLQIIAKCQVSTTVANYLHPHISQSIFSDLREAWQMNSVERRNVVKKDIHARWQDCSFCATLGYILVLQWLGCSQPIVLVEPMILLHWFAFDQTEMVDLQHSLIDRIIPSSPSLISVCVGRSIRKLSLSVSGLDNADTSPSDITETNMESSKVIAWHGWGRLIDISWYA